MIKLGWSRTYINRQIGRIKQIFKWAAAQELIPVDAYQALLTVAGLRKGKTEARENDPVRPIAENWMEQTIPRVSRQVAGMIRLMHTTGIRPGEAVIMRGCDLDPSATVWVYRPQRHKTQHHGHDRIIYLGPKAQEIIHPFLKSDLQAHLFSPADAEAERREKLHETRKTPLNAGNGIGTNRSRRPQKKPADHYTIDSYRRAIADACDAAFPPPGHLARQKVQGRRGEKDRRWETRAEWRQRLGAEKWSELRRWQNDHRWHPHQLRHSAATRLRKQYGLEAARVVLGQKSDGVAEIYAEVDLSKAEKIMGEVG
jgi:integrase